MKTTSKKKIIVSTLAIAMGAALAGSISGSVAWYQYSTKAAAQVAGTSAGTEGRLLVSKTSATADDFEQYVELGTAQCKPITASGSAGSLTYYDRPVYQVEQLAEATSGYFEYSLYFKYETNEEKDPDWQAATKKIYLSYFEIENVASNEKDISGAVRVEFIGTHNFLFGKEDAGEEITTARALDLNSNGELDTDYWDCQDLGGRDGENQLTYTTGSASYSTQAHSAALVTVDESNVYTLDTGNENKVLISTGAELKVRVWIDGFALINAADSLSDGANWTADFIEQNFKINMQFACQADRS